MEIFGKLAYKDNHWRLEVGLFDVATNHQLDVPAKENPPSPMAFSD